MWLKECGKAMNTNTNRRDGWYAVEHGTSVLCGSERKPHVFDTYDIARSYTDRKLKQKRTLECDLKKKLDWPEYEPISIIDYRRKYAGITQTVWMSASVHDSAHRSVAEDIRIINEFLIDIADEQCEGDVRALIDRIQREISEVM